MKKDNPHYPKNLHGLGAPFEKTGQDDHIASSRLDSACRLFHLSDYTSVLQITKATEKHALQPSWAVLYVPLFSFTYNQLPKRKLNNWFLTWAAPNVPAFMQSHVEEKRKSQKPNNSCILVTILHYNYKIALKT